MITIRNANSDDLDWIIQESEALASLAVHPKMAQGYDVEVVKSQMLGLMKDHLFIVAEVDGERAGFMAGAVVTQRFVQTVRILQEVLWWVTPKFRKMRVGEALLDVFTKWGEMNVDVIWCIARKDSGRIVDALNDKGYRKEEVRYSKYVGNFKE